MEDSTQPFSIAQIKSSLFENGLKDQIDLESPRIKLTRCRSKSVHDIFDDRDRKIEVSHITIQKTKSFRTINNGTNFNLREQFDLINKSVKIKLLEIKQAKLANQRNAENEVNIEVEKTDSSELNDHNGRKLSKTDSNSSIDLTCLRERKSYSPVYNRTRSICRHSNTSWETSSNSKKISICENPFEHIKENQINSNENIDTDSTKIPKIVHIVVDSDQTEEDSSLEPSIREIKGNFLTPYDEISQHSAISDSAINKIAITGSPNAKIKRHKSLKQLRSGIQKAFTSKPVKFTLDDAEKFPGTNIPKFVMVCIETLEQKDFLKTEGIYRSSPSKILIRKIMKYGNAGQYNMVENINDPILLSAALKTYFYELKHHIFTDEILGVNIAKSLTAELSEKHDIKFLKSLIHSLSPASFETLTYLMKHLKKVADLCSINRMTAFNLGILWAPCLFTINTNQAESVDLLIFMDEHTRLTELMITKYDILFAKKEDGNEICEKTDVKDNLSSLPGAQQNAKKKIKFTKNTKKSSNEKKNICRIN